MKLYRLIILLTIFLWSAPRKMMAQQNIDASIYDIISMAQQNSPNYLLAQNRKSNAYWRFVSAKALFKPQLNLQGTLPSLNRSISSISLPDGSEAFINRAFMRNSVGVNLQQVIGKTGGTVFASTSLERLDIFKTDTQDARTSYLSNPIQIGINQPILGFNPFKWNKAIADVEYKEAKKQYIEEMENIAFQASNNFFDLYITEIQLQQSERNANYLDSIAQNSKGRYEVGRISETDLLQIQLSAKNATSQVAQLELNLQNKTEQLRVFLGIENYVSFDLKTPDPKGTYNVDKEVAMRYAKENRSITETFRLRLLNAKRQLDQAKKENGPNLRLNGTFGLTQAANDFANAYNNLLDQETVSLSFNIPIADFGRIKAQKEIAKSNLEIVKLQLKQDSVSFEREIIVNVEQFELIKNQLELSKEALDIAYKRLDIAKKRFNVGKIDVTNLNIAIQEEISARQRYYQTLWSLWSAHYTLRNLTLYDFENQMPISY